MVNERQIFKPGDIVFSRNDTLLSKLIRIRTLSQWSECGVILGRNDGTIKTISARFKDGVKVGKLRDWGTSIQVLRIESATDENIQCMLDFLVKQVGKPYDCWAIADFWCTQKLQSDTRWFSSQLVYASIVAAGINLFKGKIPKFVTPGDLYENPLLTFVSSLE